MSWLSFNGISTQSLPGVEVSVMPSHRRAGMRYTEFYVNGRDGALHIDNGLSNIELKAKLVLIDAPAETRQIVNSWLRGSGKLILSDDPTKCYRASVRKEIRWDRVQGNRGYFDTVDVSFDCEPYMYEAVETPFVIDQYSADPPVSITESVFNPGTAEALPLMEFQGYGGAEISIKDANNVVLTTLTISGIPAYSISKVYLDCESGYAYTEADAAGLTLNGDFPVIPAGNSSIAINNKILTMKILWHWRWI